MSVWRRIMHRRHLAPVPSAAALLAERRPETLAEAAAMERERAAIMARVADLCQEQELDRREARDRADVA